MTLSSQVLPSMGLSHLYHCSVIRANSDALPTRCNSAKVPFVACASGIAINKLTYSWLADKNSPYAFDDVEMRRFNVAKRLERLKAGKQS